MGDDNSGNNITFGKKRKTDPEADRGTEKSV